MQLSETALPAVFEAVHGGLRTNETFYAAAASDEDLAAERPNSTSRDSSRPQAQTEGLHNTL